MTDNLYIVAIDLGGYTVPALMVYSEDASSSVVADRNGPAGQGPSRGARVPRKHRAARGECTLASLLTP